MDIFEQLHPSFESAVKTGLRSTLVQLLQQKLESDEELKDFEQSVIKEEADYGSW
ncbi:hypothetical protein [Methyloversatilis sp.]|uniref:hypothetical protein n=1 Tax=Methyloversatilis sp. TaxID=2569862 RepID=UPI0035AEE0C1